MLRSMLAVLSTAGLIAAVSVYLASFAGLTLGPESNTAQWIIGFFAGVAVLCLPMVLVEYDGALSDRKLFWRRFAESRPKGSILALKISGAVALVHSILFAVLTRDGSPDVIQGQYVLNQHGTVQRVISEMEYLSLSGWEVRFFASFWSYFYLFVTLYWWFPAVRGKPGPYE